MLILYNSIVGIFPLPLYSDVGTYFFQPQPSVTVTHDTSLFISKTIEKTSDETCQKVSMKDKMDCMMEKLQQKLVSEGKSCLPFYYYNVLPKLNSHFSICKDDQEAKSIHGVRNPIVLDFDSTNY